MKGLIDIHNHILYGVDDGAQSIEDSMKLIKEEYHQGVRKIIMTPHFHYDEFAAEQSMLKEKFDKLKLEVIKKYPNMELYLGQEIMASEWMTEWLHSGTVIPMAESRYVLVEFFPRVSYADLQKFIQQLLLGGHIPIIAHCERYECLRGKLKNANIKRIRHLTDMGSCIQVNAQSVYGAEKKFVRNLIDNDVLHFIGTDAHNITERGVSLDKCVNYLQKKYNNEYIRWLLVENPQKIINNQYIE